MAKKRKIPERMCVGCREKRPKRDLIRVVRSPEGEVSLDFTGKKSGRGAYICHSSVCLEKAKKNKGIARALEITLDPDIWENLKSVLETGGKERDK